eukprot:3938908-Rhodomonas_salina.1
MALQKLNDPFSHALSLSHAHSVSFSASFSPSDDLPLPPSPSLHLSPFRFPQAFPIHSTPESCAALPGMTPLRCRWCLFVGARLRADLYCVGVVCSPLQLEVSYPACAAHTEQ